MTLWPEDELERLSSLCGSLRIHHQKLKALADQLNLRIVEAFDGLLEARRAVHALIQPELFEEQKNADAS